VSSRSFAAFLSQSLGLLEAECPAAYEAVCLKLGERLVAIQVDGESVRVRARRGRLSIDGSSAPVAARASASRAALMALLDGETTLTRSILSDQIVLTGAIDDLVAFYEGLVAYFRGAVRSPSFPRLYEAFMGTTDHPVSAVGAMTDGKS
jgi:hypothetical protein